jgi:hypothetical protein
MRTFFAVLTTALIVSAPAFVETGLNHVAMIAG